MRQSRSDNIENPHIFGLLKAVNADLDSGNHRGALRSMDRIWRHIEPDTTFAHLYGRLLLQTGEYASAVTPLEFAANSRPDPVAEAALTEALFWSKQIDRAVARLDAALRRFAVVPGEPLARIAHQIVEAKAIGIRGWVGVSPNLDVVGELVGARRSTGIELRSSDGSLVLECSMMWRGHGEAALLAMPPRTSAHLQIEVEADGAMLLGSGFSYLPRFNLDARVTTVNGRITGWVSLGWMPSLPIEVRFEDASGNQFRVATQSDPAMPLERRFEVDPALAGFGGGRIEISGIIPGYGLEPFPDSPLLLERDVPPAPWRVSDHWSGRVSVTKALHCAAQTRNAVDVIIPVYLGREESLACIKSLLETCGGEACIVVVDDASPDSELSAALDRLAASGSITLLRNEQNLGFPGAVNRGLALHPDRDVVVLNSDTSVHGDWLKRLRTAAYSAADIGTVTPLTNEGSIASYPRDGGRECTVAEAGELDQLAAAINTGMTIELPVGVGFCLYLRRDCLNEVGFFDQATFAQGYGEESDLCIRANEHGWRNILAADVFVQHLGSRSFGSRQQALLARSRRLMNLRYPGYDVLIKSFIAIDPIAPARRRLDETRLAAITEPVVLLVTHALTGGVSRFVEERAKHIREGGSVPLIIQPNETGCILSIKEGAFLDLRYQIPEELPALSGLFERLSIEHVELHHFLDLDSRLIDAIFGLSVPCDVYVHDYIWICPRVTLINGAGRYCGEPSPQACERCIKKNGSMITESISVKDLRARSGTWLRSARAVIAPSSDAAARLVRYFPDIEPRVEPLELDQVGTLQWSPAKDLIRVVLIGAIGENKGYQVLLACARDAAMRNLNLEFVVIGYTDHDEPLLKTGKVFITGRYKESEIETLLARERPHLAFFPSVWPETWCYSLTPALRAGLQIVAFDLGSIAERLRATKWGILIPLDVDTSALNTRFLEMAAMLGEVERPDGYDTKRQVKQKSSALMEPNDFMTEQNGDVMSAADASETTMDKGLTASVQVLDLTEGIYFFSVRAAAPAPVLGADNLTLPAVHVGLGPGISLTQVEFMPGPHTVGNWLCASGDSLVAKVSAAAAPIILTSLRAPGGEILAIDVERLGIGDGTRLLGTTSEAPTEPSLEPEDQANPPLAIQVMAHIKNRGDKTFSDFGWAGRIGRGLWIEAFAVTPLEALTPADIEYKALTATGFETPWVGSGASCGTRGLAVPLVGFSIRLKQEANLRYECAYSGYFQSGAIIGPVSNGQPCRSTLPNDPLEGIRVRITRRDEAADRPPPSVPAGSHKPSLRNRSKVSPSAKPKRGIAAPAKPNPRKFGRAK